MNTRFWLIWLLLLCSWADASFAADVFPIREESDVSTLKGKESDWIFGDFVIQNDLISAVIANPIATRNANMTVRGVGACIIDLTLRDAPNDQLSAFYPAAGRYRFQTPS